MATSTNKHLVPLAALFLATLLCCADVAAAKEETPAPTPAPASGPGPGPAPAPAPGPAGFDADATCRELAQYPKLCYKLVKIYNPASADGLVEAAINETISKANRARKGSEKLLKANEEDESVSEPLKRCTTGYGKVAEKLGESLRRIRDGKKKSGTRRISDARSVIEFCYDSFDPAHDYNGLLDFPGKRFYTNVKKLVANAYNLACGSKDGDCTNF